MTFCFAPDIVDLILMRHTHPFPFWFLDELCLEHYCQNPEPRTQNPEPRTHNNVEIHVRRINVLIKAFEIFGSPT